MATKRGLNVKRPSFIDDEYRKEYVLGKRSSRDHRKQLLG
jgi:hypothetical protein